MRQHAGLKFHLTLQLLLLAQSLFHVELLDMKRTTLLLPYLQAPGVVVQFNGNGWIRDGLACDYLKKVIDSFSFTKWPLIWDAYKCHTSDGTRKQLECLFIYTAVIPDGCTKFIQAPDVVWNAIFKSQLCQYYDTWLAEPNAHGYTKRGNMKPPARSLLCKWVNDAWDTFVF